MSTHAYFPKFKTFISYLTKSDFLYNTNSYSQEGEDLIIQDIFNGKSDGFYVDIGAHHPFRYSNTYLLYKSGWSGINIDPTPKTKRLFDRLRPKDTNLELAIGKKTKGKFYTFSDPAFNTFSKSRMEEVTRSGQSDFKYSKMVQILPLFQILTKFAKNIKIDLFNIDTEGWELNILRTNDWKQFIPKVIVVENNSVKSPAIKNYLTNKGYNLLTHTSLTEIYTK